MTPFLPLSSSCSALRMGSPSLVWPLLTSAGLSGFLAEPLVPEGQAGRPPWVRIVAFIPHPPHLLTTPLDGYGLCFVMQARPDAAAFYAVRVPRIGILHPASSGPHLAMSALAFCYSFRHQDLKGTFTLHATIHARRTTDSPPQAAVLKEIVPGSAFSTKR